MPPTNIGMKKTDKKGVSDCVPCDALLHDVLPRYSMSAEYIAIKL